MKQITWRVAKLVVCFNAQGLSPTSHAQTSADNINWSPVKQTAISSKYLLRDPPWHDVELAHQLPRALWVCWSWGSFHEQLVVYPPQPTMLYVSSLVALYGVLLWLSRMISEMKSHRSISRFSSVIAWKMLLGSSMFP